MIYHYIRLGKTWWPYRGIMWHMYPKHERWATRRKLYRWMTGYDGMPK